MSDQPTPDQEAQNQSQDAKANAEDVLSSFFQSGDDTAAEVDPATEPDASAEQPESETEPTEPVSAKQPPADPLDQLGDQYLAALLGKGFTRKQVVELVRADGADSVRNLAERLYAQQPAADGSKSAAKADPTDADLGIKSEEAIAARLVKMGVDEQVAAELAKEEYAEKRASALKAWRLEQQLSGQSQQTAEQQFVSTVKQFAASVDKDGSLYGGGNPTTQEQRTNLHDVAVMARLLQRGAKEEFGKELDTATAIELSHFAVSGKRRPASPEPSPKAKEQAAKRHNNRDVAPQGSRATADIHTNSTDDAEAVLRRAFKF